MTIGHCQASIMRRRPQYLKHYANPKEYYGFLIEFLYLIQSVYAKSEVELKYIQLKILPLGPNHSLNRTFCGVGQSGFISFSPNCPTPQNAG